MANPRGIEFYDYERPIAADYGLSQDRAFARGQLLLAGLLAAAPYSSTGALSAQKGIVFGFKVTPGAALSVNIADGEALIPDSSATGEDAPYRLAKLDRASAGLGVLNLVLAAAPAAGQSRIDLVYAQAAVEQRASEFEARLIRDGSGNLVSTSVAKRTRAASSVAVATGIAAVNPAAPVLPANAITLAYVRVANGDTTPSVVADARTFVFAAGLAQMHGIVFGCALQYVSATTLRIPSGAMVIGGETVKVSANFDFAPSAKLGNGVALSASSWRYVYAYRRNRTTTGDFDVTVSSLAPGADGSPSATALPGDQVAAAIGAPGWTSPMLYVGCFYLDGSATIAPFSRRGETVVFTTPRAVATPTFDVTAAAPSSSAATGYALGMPAHVSRALVEINAQIGTNADAQAGASSTNPWGSIALFSDAGATKREALVAAGRVNAAGSRGNADMKLPGFDRQEIEAPTGSTYAVLTGANGAAGPNDVLVSCSISLVGFVDDLSRPVHT